MQIADSLSHWPMPAGSFSICNSPPLLAMTVDPWILAFSAVTVLATILMGFWSARGSKTAHDFFVAGRSVSVGWNASAISGEYLSAASFMGVAGMVMSSGYDALWYPVCYACGYLFLLLFIAGPLRRFGAYTIPDFAEGRYDSPLFRKIAVVFVLFIGFFYTMPQMKGAGTTLAYIFPGLPYWAGVVLVGAVITLNVALGGMKGITLVQAVQYWIKMFAISVPIFVLMAVYGHYGKQLELNGSGAPTMSGPSVSVPAMLPLNVQYLLWENDKYAPHINYSTNSISTNIDRQDVSFIALPLGPYKDWKKPSQLERIWKIIYPTVWTRSKGPMPLTRFLKNLQGFGERKNVWVEINLFHAYGHDESEFSPENYDYSSEKSKTLCRIRFSGGSGDREKCLAGIEADLKAVGISAIALDETTLVVVPTKEAAAYVELARLQLNSGVKSAADPGRKLLPEKAPADSTWLSPFGPLTTKAAKAAKLSAEESKPYSLLYTYSLIIALVCGTAGLPHILVRFYTNPDGAAAKRTTMWVMILIGVFYVFPPVFGVLGRNLLPELYNGVGAKGTDKIVLELPRILNEKYGVLGSVLSGITCAGAFAAFMSTFSGLLVSMTGALAHDVYGRMLRPQSTPEQRLRAFKICAVICGAGAMLLGFLVEGFEINKMVGWAFAIAAASYFPLLFMSVWWRRMTMKGAATGMLTGGTLSLVTVVSTMLADQVPWARPLADYYATHPLLRILCEQPAIWAVPLALGLMVVVSKLTASEVPDDIRMKMLVLHAPEQLGLKQEYIQEHQPGH